ncbi:MAG: hypothetical protein HOL70_13335, partial [Candidatus Marinimicrobia bacterium]|nr:hypothetical protein [Candidatus Neomarinimicrobiota bacterium]
GTKGNNIGPDFENQFDGSIYDLRIWATMPDPGLLSKWRWLTVPSNRSTGLAALYEFSVGSGATAYDRSGNGVPFTFYGDPSPEWNIAAPVGYPQNLTASGAASEVRLVWHHGYGSTIRRYDVYRGTTENNLAIIDTVGGLPLDSSFTDQTVANGVTYYYQVKARDMEANESIASNTVSAIPRGIVYVDGTNGSNDTGTGSSGAPYATIQHSIDQAINADTIYVKPGIYAESIDLLGKWISVRSTGGKNVTTLEMTTAESAAITAQSGEDEKTEVVGFTIQSYQTGLYLTNGSSPTIKNCFIDACYVPASISSDNNINLVNISLGVNGQDAIELSGGTIGYSGSSVTREWNLSGVTLNVTASLVVQSNSANAVSSLKINGDAIFAFPDGEGIQVGHSSDSGKRGIINASGATFTAQDQDDQWAGIRFNNYSDDAGTILENCTVEYATAGIYCQSSSPTITNNTFRYNTDGIDADNASAPLVSGNTFIANTYPVQYFAQNIDSTLYGNTYLGNYLTDSTSSNFIYVYGEGDDYRLSSNKTYDWLSDGAPYRITDDLHVWEDNSNSEIAVLKIYPGAALLFEPGTHLQIGSTSDGDAGALQADSVTFSRADTNGWDRIKIYNYASDELTVINNCVIEYATDGINIESASPTITSSSIRYNTNGINVDASSEPVIRDNSFTANGVPVYICARSIDGNIQGNTYENNTTNAIVVYGTEDD